MCGRFASRRLVRGQGRGIGGIGPPRTRQSVSTEVESHLPCRHVRRGSRTTLWRQHLAPERRGPHRVFAARSGLPCSDGGAAAESGSLLFKDMVEFSVGDLVVVVGLPIVLFRWRMVLESDELSFVFVRVRRLTSRELVEAKCIAGGGWSSSARTGRTSHSLRLATLRGAPT